MSENLKLKYKINKEDSMFRGNVLLIVGRTGIACSVENHEYKSLADATEALSSALPVLIRMATEEFSHDMEGRMPTKNELEILSMLIEIIDKL